VGLHDGATQQCTSDNTAGEERHRRAFLALNKEVAQLKSRLQSQQVSMQSHVLDGLTNIADKKRNFLLFYQRDVCFMS
jgi:hypothetical protein